MSLASILTGFFFSQDCWNDFYLRVPLAQRNHDLNEAKRTKVLFEALGFSVSPFRKYIFTHRLFVFFIDF